MKLLILCACLGLFSPAARAACPDVSLMQNAARGWLAGRPVPDPLVWSMTDARCAYDSFRAVLQAQMGPPVGVRIGLLTDEAQRRYGIDQPIVGMLFAPMLVADGGRLSLRGSRNPRYKADLVLTVGSRAIMQAKTREDVLRALRDVRPFIEVPDVALPADLPVRAPLIAAYGGMPWRGVLGKPLAIADMADPIADLQAMQVVLKVNGQPVASGHGEALSEHPLDVVLWLVRQGGYDLSEGSVVALGIFGGLGPAQPGQRLDADYQLGGKAMRASVSLTR